jgi:hypothetical protein
MLACCVCTVMPARHYSSVRTQNTVSSLHLYTASDYTLRMVTVLVLYCTCSAADCSTATVCLHCATRCAESCSSAAVSVCPKRSASASGVAPLQSVVCTRATVAQRLHNGRTTVRNVTVMQSNGHGILLKVAWICAGTHDIVPFDVCLRTQ